MSEIHIAFAVDTAYLNQIAVTVASIVANAAQPEHLRFHIVHAEDQDFVLQQVDAWGVDHLDIVRSSNPFSGADLGGRHVSVAALLKTQLPTALPHLDRAIYLDADIVVLQDIGQLWGVDLGGAALGGVIDIGVYRHMVRGEAHGRDAIRKHLVSLGLDPTQPQYVNSGLLLMDLEKLRGTNFSRAALEMDANRSTPRMFVDQDIINALIRGEAALLDPRWNVLAKGLSRADSRQHHYVPEMLRPSLSLQQREQWAIHYIGRNKPWNSTDVWGAEAWWRYAPLSGIAWQRPAGPTPTLLTAGKNAWLDLRAKLSAWRYSARLRQNKRSKRQQP